MLLDAVFLGILAHPVESQLTETTRLLFHGQTDNAGILYALCPHNFQERQKRQPFSTLTKGRRSMLPGGPEREDAQIQLLMGEADWWRKWEWQAASGGRLGAAKRETAGGPERRTTRRGGRGRPEELVANKDVCGAQRWGEDEFRRLKYYNFCQDLELKCLQTNLATWFTGRRTPWDELAT
ncbi:hypothetical protein X797_010676 [Metarhizium robertsii]|uniref:Uncharacterized protein n=1 Tax=Metarhizium robertsii TaxID=568076 RepID=A0A014PKG7_9HYPO|nr:hypothetical protein X797_010676 [Metarhizium robertsii]